MIRYEDLDGGVALITGGTTGIGLGIARVLAQHGMRLLINGRSESQGRKSVQELHDAGADAVFVSADVGTEEGVDRLFDALRETYGALDLLCNNAGIQELAPFAEMPVSVWDQVMQTNVRSAFLCSQHALPFFRARGKGNIVNMSSTSGLQGYATGVAYAASKAAMLMMSNVLALELAPEGIRVNCLCPGGVRTRLVPADAAGHLADRIPIGRLGEPEDVGDLVAFLASDRAAYINGGVFRIDGGTSAGRIRMS